MNQLHILAVPAMSRTMTPETRPIYLQHLKNIGAQRIWIAFERDTLFMKDRSADLKNLEESLRYFEANGIEAGVWFQTFGFGDPYNSLTKQVAGDWTHLTSIYGKTIPGDAYCPEDPRFIDAYCSWVTDIAKLQPKLMMLDDDHCLSIRPGLGCFCKYHRKLYEEALGEPLPEEGLDKLIFTGPGNRYRDAWLDVCRDTHMRFCAKVRAAVDAVNPEIRVGLSSGYSSWDIEGADAMEVSRALAGNTKPFLRLTGAPYWAAEDHQRYPGYHLNMVIEISRAQEAWTRDSGIEIFDENDSYPRPSYHTSVSLVECLDLALRAHGNIGSLKYVFDYVSSPNYETSYVRNHMRNMPFYAWIQNHFSDKTVEGVKLYRDMRTIRNANLPEEFIDEPNVMIRFFPTAASFLSEQSIPVSYEDGPHDCGIAFGDDVLSIESMPKKLILDFPAALHLQNKGIDVGIRSWKNVPMPSTESFLPESGQVENLKISMVWAPNLGTAKFYDCDLADDAVIHSRFLKEESSTGSYVYDNGTTKFLVLAFDAQTVSPASTMFRSYSRQKQLLNFIGGDFPVIRNYPGTYTLYKTNGNSAAALFENLSLDPMFEFDIELAKPCKEMELFGAEGTLSEDGMRIHITSDVAPYSAIGVALTY